MPSVAKIMTGVIVYLVSRFMYDRFFEGFLSGLGTQSTTT